MTNATTRRRGRLMRLGAVTLAGGALLGGGSGAGAGEDFVAGSGRARASIFEIVPRTGGLTIPVSFGRASASFQGTGADASSVALRPPEGGAPASNWPVAECGDKNPGGGGGGGPAPSPGLQNPFAHTLKVSSNDEDAAAGRHASSLASPPGSPVEGAGSEQEVAATRHPSSRALTVEGRFGLVDVVGYTQARAESTAGVVDGKARVAAATVTLDRLDLLDGLVSLERLRWEASQRTGEDPHDEGSFSVGRITVAGAPLPAPPAGAVDPLTALNTALAPTGFVVDVPRVEKADGVVRVSPMSFRLSDSPLGRATLGPLLGAAQPVRDPLVDQLLSFSCDFGAAVTVADVVASIAAGAGGVSFDVGGVSATTEGVVYDNPFDGPLDDPFGAPALEALPLAAEPEPALTLADPGAADLTPLAPPPAPSFDYGFTPVPAAGDPGLVAVSPDEVAAPGQAFLQPAAGPSSRHLDGNRGGTALVVGLLGVLAVAGLAVADALHLRRAARTIP